MRRILYTTILVVIALYTTDAATFRKAIFPHHSVGGVLWQRYPEYSNLPNATTIPDQITAYNTNHGYTGANVVTMAGGDATFFPVNTPGENDWWKWQGIFAGTDGESSTLTGWYSTYSIIVIKTCYLATQYMTIDSIAAYKTHYRAIITVMKNHPNNFFCIWTNYPAGTDGHASRDQYSNLFSTWAKDTLAKGLDSFGAFPRNVYVFDVFHKLASSVDGYCDPSYASGSEGPGGDHPTNAACAIVDPLFVQETFNAAIAYEGTSYGVHYVATNGSSGNSGTIGSPWDLKSTLAGSHSISPGDTVYVRGGTYINPTNGTYGYAWTCSLQGTASAPIVIRAYPGEHPILDGKDTGPSGQSIFLVGSNYVWYWGLEVMSSDGRRVDNVDWLGSGGSYLSPIVHVGTGVDVNQDITTTGNKFIACTIDNAQGGVSSTAGVGGSGTTSDIEFYDCHFYNNGWYNSAPGIRGMHGHNIYVHNNTGHRCSFYNCISANAVENNVQAWGGLAGTDNNDYIFDQFTSYWGGGHDGETLLGAYNFSNLRLTNSQIYGPGTATILKIGYSSGTLSGGNISNNYIAGGGWSGACSFSGTTTNSNTAYLQYSEGTSFPGSVTNSRPSGLAGPFIHKSQYETGRAVITLFNWSGASSVSVDLSSVFNNGDTYTIVDAQNPHVTLLTGTYSGPISIPIPGSGSAFEQYITHDGGAGLLTSNVAVVHSSNEFACFIATGGSGGSLPPTPVVTTSGTLNSFGSIQVGSSSASQNYTVSGSNLTADILITPPTGFQLSTNNSTWFSSLTITRSGSGVNPTTVYVRFTPTQTGVQSGNITNTSTGATAQNIAVTGTGTAIVTPTITVSTTSLSSFGSVNVGSSSAAKKDTVSGTNLTAPLVITAPNGYTVSTDSVTFASSITLQISAGGNGTGKHYYVSTSGNGSNNGLSSGAPWNLATLITKSLTRGDTVSFHVGEIQSTTLFVANQTGVLYNSYGVGAKPIFKNPGGGTYGDAIEILGNAITLDGLLADTTGYGGIHIMHGADSNVVRNCEVKNAGESIAIHGRNNLVTHNYVHHAKMVVNTPSPGNDDYGAMGIYLANSYNEVSWNQIDSCYAPSYDYGVDGGSIEIYAGENNENVNYCYVHHNICIDNDGMTEIGSDGNSRTVYGFVENYNTYANTQSGAFPFVAHIAGTFATDVQGWRLENNTIYVALPTFTFDWAIKWESATMTSAILSMTNNVIITSNYWSVFDPNSSGTPALSHNDFWSIQGTSNVGKTMGSGDIFADPSLTSLPTNLRPLSTSPGINAGVALAALPSKWIDQHMTLDSLSIVGNPDMGAYEYNGGKVTIYSSISNVPIYTRFSPTSSGLQTGSVSYSSTGATTKFVSVTGTGVLPATITTSVTSLPNFGSVDSATFSPATTYTVSGVNLGGDITVTAPTNFTISKDSITFVGSVVLTQSGGAVAATKIYARFAPGSSGAKSGNINHTSAGATTKTVAVSGTGLSVAPPAVITVSATSLASFGNVVINAFSLVSTYQVSGTGLVSNVFVTAPGGFQVSKNNLTWGSSATYVQSGGTLSASTVYVRFAPTSAVSYSGAISDSSGSATTKYVAVTGTGINPPLVTAITTSLGTIPDFGQILLGDTSKPASYTVSGQNLTSNILLTAPSGFYLSTDFIDYFGQVALPRVGSTVDPTTVYVVFAPTVATTYTGLILHSSSGASDLSVSVSGTGINPPTAAITVNQTVLHFGGIKVGVNSASQIDTVSGANLSANIVITAPSGFGVSTDNSTFTSSVTLTQVAGTVAKTAIFIRFSPVAYQNYSGNVTHTSTGAAEQDIAVDGVGIGYIPSSGTPKILIRAH